MRKPVGPGKGREIACQLLLQASQTRLGENQFHLLPVKIDSHSKKQRRTPNQHLSPAGPPQGPTSPPPSRPPYTQSTAGDGLRSALTGFSVRSFPLTLSPAPAWALHRRQGRSAPVSGTARRRLPLLALPPAVPRSFFLTPLLSRWFCPFFPTFWQPHPWLRGWALLGCGSLERLEEAGTSWKQLEPAAATLHRHQHHGEKPETIGCEGRAEAEVKGSFSQLCTYVGSRKRANSPASPPQLSPPPLQRVCLPNGMTGRVRSLAVSRPVRRSPRSSKTL